MDKIAVIADVHGNYSALSAVLEDIKKREIEHIICLGDTIGKGQHPNEGLNLLRDATLVLGTWEDFFINKLYATEKAKKRYDLLETQLSDENKELLSNIELCHEMYISGRLVRMFHATPLNAWDNVIEIDRIDKLYSQFLPTKYTSDKIADVVIYAHTHTQNLMKLYNRTLINTGSVGNAFDIIRNETKDSDCENTTNADYLIIEGVMNSTFYSDINFEFVSLKYNREKEIEGIRGIMDEEVYLKELQTGQYRNKEKYEQNFIDAHYNLDAF